jgi:hypothetical protein
MGLYRGDAAVDLFAMLTRDNTPAVLGVIGCDHGDKANRGDCRDDRHGLASQVWPNALQERDFLRRLAALNWLCHDVAQFW